MALFDSTFSVLEKSLDLRAKRHAVLSGNVANSETPKYQARELDFAGELSKALGEQSSPLVTTHPRHLDVSAAGEAHVTYDNSGAMGADGNNVDLDIVMGKLSSNARAYTEGVSYLTQKFRFLREVIRNGGGGV